MGVPLIQKYRVAKYLIGKKLRREERYPLVLMLEPLFRCNLACAGCGKIDHPELVLNKRLSVEECLQAVDECGAPVVSIPGGEPLLHSEMPAIVEGIVARKRFVYLCTNALLLAKHIDRYEVSKYLTFSVHLDGLREQHDRAVCQEGVFDRAVKAVRLARERGFRVTLNCTLFNEATADEVTEFLDYAMTLGVEGVTISPGFRYDHAPQQEIFFQRSASKELFRELFRRGGRKRWRFNHSSLFLDFLAGNQTYQCTPWGNPTRNVFGWQKPCYLLVDEGYAETFDELMHDTDWNAYGLGRNPKCDDCQVHCGFEPTAVKETFAHPLRAALVALRGPRTEGPFAPDLAQASPSSVELAAAVHAEGRLEPSARRDSSALRAGDGVSAGQQQRAKVRSRES